VIRRASLVVVAALVAVAALAGPAAAHVTIQPPQAKQGGFATEVFQVPNEQEDASTTSVEVTFPTDHPIAFVSVESVPGWTADVQKSKLDEPIKSDDGEVTEAVSKITWTGGTIEPGHFQRFPVSMGPLPDVSSLEFKAVQTYSNGEKVEWIQSAVAGGDEPQHPAPVLTLTKSTDAATSATTTAKASGSGDGASSSDVDSAKTLGIVGIVVGALGVVLAGVAIARRSKAS
jgi:uncharacterized protein YcnI